MSGESGRRFGRREKLALGFLDVFEVLLDDIAFKCATEREKDKLGGTEQEQNAVAAVKFAAAESRRVSTEWQRVTRHKLAGHMLACPVRFAMPSQ